MTIEDIIRTIVREEIQAAFDEATVLNLQKTEPKTENQNSNDFIKTVEAAALISRSPATLRKWASCNSGPIKPRRVNGARSRLLWSRSEIEKILGIATDK